MKNWLSKIRLWELALLILCGFGSYFLWSATQSQQKIANKTVEVLDHTNNTITNIDKTTTEAGQAISGVASSISLLQQSVSTAIAPVAGTVTRLNTTLDKVNAPCVPGPCGTLADVNKTLNTFRMTAGQVEIAANHFDKNEAKFYSQEDQIYADVHDTLYKFNSLITSKDLTDTIHNGNVITANIGKTTEDFQNKFHDFLYPPPCTKYCGLKMAFRILKDTGPFMRPAFYGAELWRAAIGR